MAFRSGYVAIVGKPNVGKSTLLNAMIGERLSIVTPKAQTTRHRIAGILTRDDSQTIFLDTPGYHASPKLFNAAMNEVVGQVIDDCDIAVIMVDASERGGDLERELFQRASDKNAMLVINKGDLIPRGEFEEAAGWYRENWGVDEVFIISALKGEGVPELVQSIRERLPEGPKYFEEDIYTEHDVRFLSSELIREELFLQMHQEIPYSCAVEVEEFTDPKKEGDLTRIKAAIIVEKDSQKAMVIGKGGSRIKEIGQRAREKIEDMVGGRVYLHLFVRVEKNWTKDEDMIKRLGYRPAG
jgi:GTP-binding protein Era